MNLYSKNSERGFTIVELMIAMLLGIILIGVVITMFIENRRSFTRDESIMRMQDDARQAMRELSNDLSMAGFWADLMLPGSVVADGSLAVGTDCGPAAVVDWIYDTVAATGEALSLTAVDNATGAAANASHSCIAAGELLAGTDVVSIKRVAGAQTAVPTANSVYLRTNGTRALLYREPAGVPPAEVVPAPFGEWEYRPRIYYIRNFAVAAGDGIPTLCRKTLQFGAPPTMVTECLAQGIENLQVEFGLDPDGNSEPNEYVAAPTLAQMQTAVSARIFIVTRSVERDLRYDNAKTYQISNAPAATPADNFYRRVYSITVALHNMASLRRLES
jgi:type IV pilus assembly protein PilW